MHECSMLSKIKSYALLMRFDKPIGTYLLLWPTLWAIWIASRGDPNPKTLILFTLGVIIMRAAGCVINDIADRKIDPHVARTQFRPLAAGDVSLTEAVVLFISLCLIAFMIVLQFNYLVILLACVALFLAILYPFLKRIISIPQVFLGLAWYLGLPMAFAAEINAVPWLAWYLYVLVTLWTVAYDTMYAMVDRPDDARIGVKSTAILFGRYDVLIISILYLIVLSMLFFLGFFIQANVSYYLACFCAIGFAAYQIYLIKDGQTKLCMQAFLNNHWLGLVIFVGLFLSHL